MPLVVLHLTGSAVSDRWDDLSRLCARGCVEALADPERYRFVLAHVSPGGAWRFPRSLEPAAFDEARALSPSDGVARVVALAPDLVVPHMFCPPGMTVYRALLELLQIPFIGNRAETMALTLAKDHARAVVSAAGVRVPARTVLEREDLPAPAGPLRPVAAGGPVTAGGPVAPMAMARIDALRWPLVVKPTHADNSDGLGLVHRPEDLAAAIAVAAVGGSRVLVEEFIAPGRELRVGLLERRGELIALALEEYPVDAETHPVRTGTDKLRRSATERLQLVAKGGALAWLVDPDDPATGPVLDLARRAHRALGCRHYSLFDIRVDPEGRPHFLEAGLYCSFSPQSVVSTMAAGAGLALPDLFAAMVEEALGPSSPDGVRVRPQPVVA